MGSPAPRAEIGPGSIAGFGSRVIGFLVDAVLADLLAIFARGGYHVDGVQNLLSYVAFLLIEIIFVTVAGQTPGMRVAGIAVVRADGKGRVALKWVLLRTLLLAAIVPALFTDGSGRAMHDRAAGTVTIRTR